MKKLVISFLTGLICLSLICVVAESVSVNASVVSARSVAVVSDFGGKIESVCVSAGDTVHTGDVLAILSTSKVYALEEGTARIFGEPGDDAAKVGEVYGAVVYVEPKYNFTISTSTKNAFMSEQNMIIHPGEKVYLRSNLNLLRTGTGRVTTVTASGYTVEVLSGNLLSSDTVSIFRSADYNAQSRIGRDSITLNAPIAYTAEGIISSFNVEDGQEVKKGDVLFETLEGSYLPGKTEFTLITAPVDGVISNISLSEGASIAAGSEAATIYADTGLRVEAQVSESDIMYFEKGEEVSIELSYAYDGLLILNGTVEKISRASTASDTSSEAYFNVLIIPESTDALSYGMHAIVTSAEKE